MNPEATIVVLVSFAGLWYLFYFAYASYRLDLLRHRLFTIRTQLFNMAEAEESLDFGHDAYCAFRTILNGHIRFAPRVNLITGLMLLATRRYRGERPGDIATFADRQAAAMATLPDHVREEMKRLRWRMDYAVAEHLLMTSGLMWLILFPAAILFWAVRSHTWFALELRRRWRNTLAAEIDGAALAGAA